MLTQNNNQNTAFKALLEKLHTQEKSIHESRSLMDTELTKLKTSISGLVARQTKIREMASKSTESSAIHLSQPAAGINGKLVQWAFVEKVPGSPSSLKAKEPTNVESSTSSDFMWRPKIAPEIKPQVDAHGFWAPSSANASNVRESDTNDHFDPAVWSYDPTPVEVPSPRQLTDSVLRNEQLEACKNSSLWQPNVAVEAESQLDAHGFWARSGISTLKVRTSDTGDNFDPGAWTYDPTPVEMPSPQMSVHPRK